MGDARQDVLDRIAAGVPRPRAQEPVRVAVDGVDGAGKTLFADGLAAALRAAGRPVIRASVDAFHRPRAQRYRRGRNSPAGFWLDSYDYDRVRTDLLDPLGANGSGRYRTAAHDLDTDEPVVGGWALAPPGAVLVLDGIFLHRDELQRYWDHSVFLDVPFAETARRMAVRDGTSSDPEHPTMARYVGGQRRYLVACAPRTRASVVIDNTDWRRPLVVPESTARTAHAHR